MSSRSVRSSQIPKHIRQVLPDALEDYFKAITAAEIVGGKKRSRGIMRAQAELLFHITGGAKCEKCPAHVRHVMRVTSVHKDGGVFDYHALCTRCLVAEEAVAEQITLSLKPEQLNLLIEALRNKRPARAVAA
jgi:hypothetical protein